MLYGVKDLRIEDITKPKVNYGEILVKVKAATTCGTDLKIYQRGYVEGVIKLPTVFGHEWAGDVAEVGEGVSFFTKGMRVRGGNSSPCLRCYMCQRGKFNLCEDMMWLWGAYAEYIKVPASNVLKLPSNLPFEQACILGCAVSTAYHALKRGRIHAGDTVVIYGIGGLGAHAIPLARIFKAEKVIAVDISDEKLKLAKKLGVDEIVNPATEDPAERLGEMTEGKLADLVLDFVGAAKVIEQEIRCVGKGGRMVLVGIGPDDIRVSPYKTIIGKEMELIGVNDHLRSELAQLVDMVGSGRIDLSASVTHRVHLDEVNTGLSILEEGTGNPIRVVIVK